MLIDLLSFITKQEEVSVVSIKVALGLLNYSLHYYFSSRFDAVIKRFSLLAKFVWE